MIGIIGKKLGMTQIFNEQGQQIPVTVIEAEILEDARSGLETSLRGVSDDCLVRAASAGSLLSLLVLTCELLLAVAELHRRDAGDFGGENLSDCVGRRFDDRAGDLLALFVEDLGHAQLLSNDSDHFLLDLDLDVDTGREIQLGESVDRCGAGVEDVDQALVGLELELLARLLVDVR